MPDSNAAAPPDSTRRTATARLASSIQAVAADAATVRVMRTVRGRHITLVLNIAGTAIPLPVQDRTTIGRWLTTTHPDTDWRVPHTFDLSTGRLWATADGGQ